MKRRIVKHGPSTFIISLPSSWIKKNGVNKGDELEVVEQDNTIKISAGEVKTNLTITKDVIGLNPALIKSLIKMCYIKGYDKVQLVHNDINIVNLIRDKVHELIGFELIEQNQKYVIIQSIANRIELDFENAFRKSFIKTKDMIDSSVEAFIKEDKEALKAIKLKDWEVNRLTNFCIRQINKNHYTQEHQSYVLHSLIEALEEIADIIWRVAILLGDIEKNPTLQNIIKNISKQFEIAYTNFYKPSKDKSNEAFLLYQKLQKMINDYPQTISNEEFECIILLKEATHLINRLIPTRLDLIE